MTATISAPQRHNLFAVKNVDSRWRVAAAPVSWTGDGNHRDGRARQGGATRAGNPASRMRKVDRTTAAQAARKGPGLIGPSYLGWPVRPGGRPRRRKP
jgi:hypothetical protein